MAVNSTGLSISHTLRTCELVHAAPRRDQHSHRWLSHRPLWTDADVEDGHRTGAGGQSDHHEGTQEGTEREVSSVPRQLAHSALQRQLSCLRYYHDLHCKKLPVL